MREIYAGLLAEMEGSIGNRVREIVVGERSAHLVDSGRRQRSADREISELEQQGLRPEAIAEYLRSRISRPRLRRAAALIARTETSKSRDGSHTRTRSEDLGINSV